MPPPESHKTLTPAEKEMLRRWIEQGAKYQKHWSFEPIRKPAVPQIAAGRRSATRSTPSCSTGWSRRGLTPSPEADRADADPPRRVRPDRPAADAGGGRRVPRRHVAGRLRADGRPLSRLAALRRRDGPPLARRRPLRRHARPAPRQRAPDVGLPRLGRSTRSTRNQPFDQFTVEQLAGDLLPKPDDRSNSSPPASTAATSRPAKAARSTPSCIFRYAVDRTEHDDRDVDGPDRRAARSATTTSSIRSRAKEFYSLYAFFNSAADPAMDGNALLTAPTIKLRRPSRRRSSPSSTRRSRPSRRSSTSRRRARLHRSRDARAAAAGDGERDGLARRRLSRRARRRDGRRRSRRRG